MRNIIEEQADYFLGDDDASKVAQVSIGQTEEYEHTDDPNEAMRIALTHLNEDEDYYLKLIPASKRDGYKIDFFGRCVGRDEFYLASIELVDKKEGWKMTKLVIIREPMPQTIEEIYRECLIDSMKKTYYKCVFGHSTAPLHNSPFFLSITDHTGYEGYHTPNTPVSVKNFMQSIYDQFHIDAMESTF